MKNLLRSCALLFSLTALTQLHAIVIDFEGESGSSSGVGSFLDIDGFRFTISNGNGSGFQFVNSGNDTVEAGTTKLLAANFAAITMTKVGGGLFALLSVDIGGSFISSPHRWADHVDVDGGSAVETATLAGQGPTFVNLATNFSSVSSVVFTPTVNANLGVNNYEFTIDNIVVDEASAVPDSGSNIAFLSLAILGIAATRRLKA